MQRSAIWSVTWREAEPEEGVYAWEAISEKYDFASLREQGDPPGAPFCL